VGPFAEILETPVPSIIKTKMIGGDGGGGEDDDDDDSQILQNTSTPAHCDMVSLSKNSKNTNRYHHHSSTQATHSFPLLRKNNRTLRISVVFWVK
jgi:hypothetical protein